MRKTGGPAFPLSCDRFGDESNAAEGMTLRDYFAAAALQGVLANAGAEPFIDKAMDDGFRQPMARLAYILADHMLAERAKGE